MIDTDLKQSRRGLLWALIGGLGIWPLFGRRVLAVTPTTPGYGVVEGNVTVGSSEKVLLVPPGNVGFFIQPQSEGASIRIGFGNNTSVSGTVGVVLGYLEAIAEQPRPQRLFHEIWAQAPSGSVTVRVVYYI